MSVGPDPTTPMVALFLTSAVVVGLRFLDSNSLTAERNTLLTPNRGQPKHLKLSIRPNKNYIVR